MMINHYSFGSITVSGERYRTDIKIINCEVIPDWWRKSGHSAGIDDVGDILDAKPEYLVIGSGKFGLMKVSAGLQKELTDRGIEVIVEKSGKAVEIFNRLYEEGKNVTAGFHLTC